MFGLIKEERLVDSLLLIILLRLLLLLLLLLPPSLRLLPPPHREPTSKNAAMFLRRLVRETGTSENMDTLCAGLSATGDPAIFQVVAG